MDMKMNIQMLEAPPQFEVTGISYAFNIAQLARFELT